jgi:hypothetical protein
MKMLRMDGLRADFRKEKTTVIALYHIGYGLGHILSPQLFQPQERYLRVAFGLIHAVGVVKTINESDRSNPEEILFDARRLDFTDRENLAL